MEEKEGQKDHQRAANTSAVADRMQKLIDNNQFSATIDLWQSMAYSEDEDLKTSNANNSRSGITPDKTILENNRITLKKV